MKTTIYFDGGSNPNPGPSYGSYEIGDGSIVYRQTWKTPHNFTNNQAEYMTLWLALHDYLAKFQNSGHLEIFSDSKLLVEQVNKRWRVKHWRMSVLHERVCALLRRIPCWSVTWNSRAVNVAKFGH